MVHGVDGNRVKFGSQLTLVVPNEDAGYFPDLERLGGTFCRLGVVDVKRSKDCFVFEVGCYPQEAGGNLRCALPRLSFLADASELSDLEDGYLRLLRRGLDELVEFVLGGDRRDFAPCCELSDDE